MNLGIACDINILHASVGNFDEVWKVYAQRFLRKWASKLPNYPFRAYGWATVQITDKREALELMRPLFWNQPQ